MQLAVQTRNNNDSIGICFSGHDTRPAIEAFLWSEQVISAQNEFLQVAHSCLTECYFEVSKRFGEWGNAL